ncbi:hypothetical protein [Prochlorococcus marinus]|uniref:Uncharacterized protein n=1 Tax=Prochlorococcus marinus XMU1408 TaxID=2213228 RepID=A0A318QXS6_PROMR|nr:hypothetical protein [Prochlorococcus marinus]MBW3042572.1 hypothetical protein [Prochlorococcus marinus str. XMU1408]PYE01295.1 hypothetical protein DNJ73_07745 [Prochlorococcus marinus XMU1408]
MNQEIKRLADAKLQWENDIKMYNDFLKSKSKTFEGKYGAIEYINMAENRINDINKKLKEIKKES